MENKLKNYLDILFEDMPQTAETDEMKSEMFQNLLDKYYDLVNDGKDPDVAYNMTIASIGDIRSLFSDNKSEKIDFTDHKKRSAILTTVAIVLYILCVVPIIILSEIGGFADVIGISLMFVMIAVATGLIIYNNMTKYKPSENETIAKEFTQWQSGKPSNTRKARYISKILWCIIVCVYLVVSFLTGAWYITWVIFIIGAALKNIIALCIETHSENEEKTL